MPFPRYIANTLFICTATIVGTVFSCAWIAYGLARINWPLRIPLFVVILGTMMIPFQVTMIPLFVIFRNIGWFDSYLPLIVPSFFWKRLFHLPAAAILYDDSDGVVGSGKGRWGQ